MKKLMILTVLCLFFANISNRNGNREGDALIYTETGLLLGKIFYKNDIPVSGSCENGIIITDTELMSMENGYEVLCRDGTGGSL